MQFLEQKTQQKKQALLYKLKILNPPASVGGFFFVSMSLWQLIETFNVNEKKIIYLLYLIPIGILSGSLIINSLIILIDI